MDTIIHDNLIYHGQVISYYAGGFYFGFRIRDKNFIWQCDYNYWTLIKNNMKEWE